MLKEKSEIFNKNVLKYIFLNISKRFNLVIKANCSSLLLSKKIVDIIGLKIFLKISEIKKGKFSEFILVSNLYCVKIYN